MDYPGNTSSKGPVSIAMLDYRSVMESMTRPVFFCFRGLTLKKSGRPEVWDEFQDKFNIPVVVEFLALYVPGWLDLDGTFWGNFPGG